MAPRMVLDTNVVLDCLVFGNPGAQRLLSAINSGAVVCLSCAEMRAELAHVLVHGQLGSRRVDVELVLTSWDRLHQQQPLTTAQPAMRPRCSDGSDQKFLDLALDHQARWLLTRDRALLKLARRVARLGLLIQPPEAWAWTPSAD